MLRECNVSKNNGLYLNGHHIVIELDANVIQSGHGVGKKKQIFPLPNQKLTEFQQVKRTGGVTLGE